MTRKIKSLHDPPSIYQEERTTIKNGLIVRSKIWRDTLGNELEKHGSSFVIKRPSVPYFHAPQTLEFRIDPSSLQGPSLSQEEEFALFLGLALMLAVMFCLGVLVGRRLGRKMADKEIEARVDLPHMIESINPASPIDPASPSPIIAPCQ